MLHKRTKEISLLLYLKCNLPFLLRYHAKMVNGSLRMAFIFQPELSALVLNAPCMIYRLQDPMSMRLCCSFSTLSFCNKLKNFQLVEGLSSETWIIRFPLSTLLIMTLNFLKGHLQQHDL